MGGVESSFVSDIDGGDVELRNDAFTPGMKAEVRPDTLIDDEMAECGEVPFV